jgi:hypothetical protein
MCYQSFCFEGWLDHINFQLNDVARLKWLGRTKGESATTDITKLLPLLTVNSRSCFTGERNL